jgi:hypothetical protein
MGKHAAQGEQGAKKGHTALKVVGIVFAVIVVYGIIGRATGGIQDHTSPSTTSDDKPSDSYEVGTDVKPGYIKLTGNGQASDTTNLEGWTLYASEADAKANDATKCVAGYSVSPNGGTTWLKALDGQWLVTKADVKSEEDVPHDQVTSVTGSKDCMFKAGVEVKAGTYTVTSNGLAKAQGDLATAYVFDDPSDPSNVIATYDVANKGPATIALQEGQFIELFGCDMTIQ